MLGVATRFLPVTATATRVRGRIQSIVSNGGDVDGARLLSPRTIELIFVSSPRVSNSRLGYRPGSGSVVDCGILSWSRKYLTVAAVSGSDGEGPSSSTTSTSR
jgi:hypothetical protein